MGIRNLNKYFKQECKNSDAIKLTSISQISGKKIAVDISIYFYKFASEGTLIENIYLMLSIFRHYNIIPIFIFDPYQIKKTNQNKSYLSFRALRFLCESIEDLYNKRLET